MSKGASHVCLDCGRPAYRSASHGWRKYCLEHLKARMNDAAQQMRDKKGPIWDRYVAAQKAFVSRF